MAEVDKTFHLFPVQCVFNTQFNSYLTEAYKAKLTYL